jgi:mannosyltransferase
MNGLADYGQNAGLRRRRGNPCGILAGIVILAALFRLAALNRSFWSDEVFSVVLVSENWGRFFKIIRGSELNMSAYYVLLRFWSWGGTSEVMIRSLSVMLALATLIVLYVLGQRLLGTREALVASLLLAVNGFHVAYSQEARGYSLVVLLVTLSTLFFVRSVEQPSRSDSLGYILSSVAAVYAHFLAALMLPAQWISLLLMRREDVPRRSLIAGTRIIGVLLLPVAFFILFRNQGQIDWVDRLSLAELSGLAYALAGWPCITHSCAPFGLEASVLVAVYALACLAGVMVCVKVWLTHNKSLESWHHAIVLTSFFVPVLLAIGISFAKPLLVPRFLLISLPALTLLVALGICTIRPPWLLGVALAAVVGLEALGSLDYYKRAEIEDWRGVVQDIVAHGSASDAIIIYDDYGRLSFDYYYGRSSLGSTLPRVVWPTTGGGDWPSNSFLSALPARYKRVWLVLVHDWDEKEAISQTIQTTLRRSYPRVNLETFHGVKVLLYAISPPLRGGGTRAPREIVQP